MDVIHTDKMSTGQASITNGASSEPLEMEMTDPFATYKKRPGTVSHGDEYEILMCGWYALKLSQRDEVLDFGITSNDKDCGSFDDVRLNVTFADGTKQTYLFQLKHKDNPKFLVEQDLFPKQGRGDFALEKYFESLSKITVEDPVCVLYTNSPMNVKSDIALQHGYKVDCSLPERLDFLLHLEETSNAQLQFQSLATAQRIYFFTNRYNVHKLKTKITDLMRTLLGCDIYGSFFHYMSEWWSGRFVLTKKDFIAKLTELALSPYVKTVSNLKSNDKTESVKQIIMQFELTLVQNDSQDLVENIWPCERIATDEDVSKTVQKFSLNSEIFNIQQSKALWYLEKVPLVVEANDSNRTNLKLVMQLFRKSSGRKKIVMVGNATKEDFETWKTFENLSDILKHCDNEQCCKDILINFKLSLQGKSAVSLEELIQIDSGFGKVIRLRELLQMSQGGVSVGQRIVNIPDFYVPRSVSTVFLHVEEIVNYYYLTKHCLLIVNCDTTMLNILMTYRNINFADLRQYLNSEVAHYRKKYILFCMDEKCTNLQFERICEVSNTANVYLFQSFDEKCCSLLLRKSDTTIFESKSLKKTIPEDEIFQHFDNPLNAFCAPPGMGKSTLMKVLSNQSPSNCWSVFVDLISYNDFLRLSENLDAETLLRHFLKLNQEEESLENQFKEIFLKSKKILLFLDGVDELDSTCTELIAQFAKRVSCESGNVWISSRENLRSKLIHYLNVVPVEIRPLDQEQQKKFVNEKLKEKYQSEKIEKIQSAIFTSADISNSQELLGIPLQLHIITEMFLHNDNAYESIAQENIFVLTRMYKLYFEAKKIAALKKIHLDENTARQLGYNFEHKLQDYEIPALKVCLDDSDFQQLNVEDANSQSFVEEVKEYGDKYGIIKTVNEENSAIFSHQTYAEYFACVWLVKNQPKAKILRDNIFSKKYDNLRLIFDVMLAEKCPLHLAIIYKNVEQFFKHLNEVDVKDCGGRTALHVACCHGLKYSKNKFQRRRKFVSYLSLVESLVKKCKNVNQCDSIFCFNYVDYCLRSGCLYPVENMLERKLLKFKALSKVIWNYCVKNSLTVFAVFYGFKNLLSELLKTFPNRKEAANAFMFLLIFAAAEDTEMQAGKELLATLDVLINHGADVNCLFSERIFNKFEIEYFADDKGSNSLSDDSFGGENDFITFIEDDDDIFPSDDDASVYFSDIENSSSSEDESNDDDDKDSDIITNSKQFSMLDMLCATRCHYCIEYFLQYGARCTNGSTILHRTAQSNKIDETILYISQKCSIDINAQNDTGKTVLHYLAKNANPGIMTMILEKGIDINVVDQNGNTALHHACGSSRSNLEVVELLVENGIDINAQNKLKKTAVGLAIENSYTEIMEYLIEKGAKLDHMFLEPELLVSYMNTESVRDRTVMALIKRGIDINTPNDAGQTPLQIACVRNSVEVATLLVLKGADIDISGPKNNLLFQYMFACRGKCDPDLVSLLITSGIDVNARNDKGECALQIAFKNNEIELAKTLVAMGADVQTLRSSTILHDFCRLGNTEMVSFFIDGNFSLDCRNRQAATALHHAVNYGHLELTKMLLKGGSDKYAVDNDRNCVFHYAAKSPVESIDLIRFLMEEGISVNARNVREETPLHLAFQRGKTSSVRFLLQHDADSNAVTSSGRTVLHYAALSNNPEMINIALSSGIDINSRDICGTTALHVACKEGDLDSVRELISYGSDINAVDMKKRTALHYALSAREINHQIVSYLLLSDIDAKNRDFKGRDALDYAITRQHYSTVKTLIETDAFMDKFIPLSAPFLFYSVYSGSVYGVNLFISSGTDIGTIDTNDEEYPLYFALSDGLIELKVLQKMTEFIGKVIETCQEMGLLYSRRKFIDYLNVQTCENNNSIFLEADDQSKFSQRFEDIIEYFTNCEQKISLETSDSHASGNVHR